MAVDHDADGVSRPATAAGRRSRVAAPRPADEVERLPGKSEPTMGRERHRTVSAPARLTRFLREVVAELRKVIWPTRNQMVTYTIVVLVFVSFMVAVVAGLDVAFAKGVFYLFGD